MAKAEIVKEAPPPVVLTLTGEEGAALSRLLLFEEWPTAAGQPTLLNGIYEALNNAGVRA